MTITEAERQVRIARRRKKNARPGYRQKAALRLEMAVTTALAAAAERRRTKTCGDIRGEANT